MLNADLLEELKVLAAREDKRISQVVEEALRAYLKRRRALGVVVRSRGSIPASPELVQAILEDEDGYLGE